jgi:hypothetical protein
VFSHPRELAIAQFQHSSLLIAQFAFGLIAQFP